MADLVRDHVGAGEIPGRAEALAQLTEELEVQIHAAVGRAVERPDRRARLAAGGLDGSGEQDEPRRLVGAAALLEEPAPGVLGVPEDGPDEVRLRIVLRGLALGSAVDRCRRRGLLDEAAQDVEGIGAREQAQHDDQEEAAASELESRPAHRHAPTVLDVLAAAHVPPAHREPPGAANWARPPPTQACARAPRPATSVPAAGSSATRRRPSLQATRWSSKIAAVLN